ncbi:MAG: type III-A CRISPR-associated RAMP protein Csm5 [Thermoplasmatales archaeon]|nr:type III-A CRISPR-associated RAMP protein Csm5 [Thermoplasmatales archaeon]
MRYEVEVISPLHIGNGRELSSIEYLVDKKFYRINMDSLFREKEFDIDGFVEDIKLGLFKIENYKELAKKNKEYVIDISNSAEKNIKGRNVKEFIKSGGRLYIPGSSIKGAIRTAVMWHVLKNNAELYGEMEEYFEEIIRGKIKKKKEEVDDEIEKNVFGKDPKYDLFKAIQISDGNILPIDRLRIDEVKILSTTSSSYYWKNFSIFIEALKIGTKFETDIKIDEFFTKEDVSKELGFDDKIVYLKNIEEICKDYSKELIDYELNFLKRYNVGGELNEVINFYEELKKKDGVLLRLSWGAGWQSMTVGGLINEEMLEELRRIYKMGKRRDYPEYVKPFPKTRRIIFEDNKPKYPLGWIRLEGRK